MARNNDSYVFCHCVAFLFLSLRCQLTWILIQFVPISIESNEKKSIKSQIMMLSDLIEENLKLSQNCLLFAVNARTNQKVQIPNGSASVWQRQLNENDINF